LQIAIDCLQLPCVRLLIAQSTKGFQVRAFNRLFCFALFLTAVSLTACSKETPTAKPKTDAAFPVQTIIVAPGNMVRTLNAVGTVRYRRETPLGFTTGGKVSSVRFDEGDFVKRGALIAALDTTLVTSDLQVADAERGRAQADFERIAALYKDGWVTKQRFEAAQAAAQASTARVSQARFATGTAQVYAPSSGIILSRNVEPGQVVGVGTPVVILGQADQGFVFRAPVVDRDAAKLRVGMTAEIVLDAVDGGPITATISEIEGQANSATGAFTVQFSLPARAKIRAGQIGSANITLPMTESNALQIPASALFGVRTGEGLVYVVDAKTNRVETRNVVIQQVMDEFVIVTGGLQQGDQIVVSGGEKLRIGAKVRAVAAAR
jgi:RND family efflux transporter MFP subunit